VDATKERYGTLCGMRESWRLRTARLLSMAGPWRSRQPGNAGSPATSSTAHDSAFWKFKRLVLLPRLQTPRQP